MISSWAPIVLAVRVMAKNGSLVGTITGLTGLPACSARLTTAVRSWRSWSVIVGFKSPEPGGRTDAVITTTSVVSGSVSARQRSSIAQVVRRTDRHQLAIGLGQVQGFHAELVGLLLVELFEVFVVLGGGAQAAAMGMLAHPEDGEKARREGDAGDRGHFLGQQVGDRRDGQRQEDQGHPDRQVEAAEPDVERHLVLAGLGPLEAEDQHRHRHEDEAPDHAEGVGLAQRQHVAPAGEDRDDLEDHHQVDQPRGRAEPGMRLQEPVGQDAVFGDAVQARRWSRRSPC